MESGRPRGFHISPHPAAIILSALLLRLAARFTLNAAVAQVIAPASEFGPLAIDELQRQTSGLLSFQKIPQAVFGAQLAFNLLPRIGHGRSIGRTPARPGGLAGIDHRIREQIRAYLHNQALQPALRVLQAPVFHSLACSLYVETAEGAPVEAMARALEGERLELRRLREPAPSQVEASGSSDILVDALLPDGAHPNGVWIWAVADNLRLSAVNAIEIAEVHASARAGGSKE